jgi:hypothetical protein
MEIIAKVESFFIENLKNSAKNLTLSNPLYLSKKKVAGNS